MAFLGSRFKVVLLLVILFFARAAPARASIPTGIQVVLIFVGVGIVGAAIGMTVYHFARKSPSITGVAASTPRDLTLVNEPDHKGFTLVAQTGGLKSAERIRVNGKRLPSGNSLFLVEKIRKDYGPCSAQLQARTE